MHQALMTLPEDKREILILARYEELKYETIAAMQSSLIAELAAAKDSTNIPTGRTPMLYFAKPVLVIAAVLGTALFVGRNLIEPTPETKVLPATVPSDAAGPAHYRGGATAPVTLLMYGDYQCPPCARYNVIVNDVLARYGDKVRLAYRHFPLLAFRSAELRERVEKDAASGRALGVAATPTFFINGGRVEPTPQPSDDFFKLIDAQLQP